MKLIDFKLKVKFSTFVPVRAMTAYEQMMVCLSPLFLNLGFRKRRVSGQNYNPAASLSPGKKALFQLNRRMSGNRSRPGLFWRTSKSLGSAANRKKVSWPSCSRLCKKRIILLFDSSLEYTSYT